MEKISSLVLSQNLSKVIVINPTKKSITEHFIGIGDTKEFSSFCYANDLQWLFRYFPTLRTFAECMGDYITTGVNDYIEAAKLHGLRLKKIGKFNYMLAIDFTNAPEVYKQCEIFCTTRPGFNEKFCGSAFIFAIEPYSPGGYGMGLAGTHTQTSTDLNVELVSELYTFNCEPSVINENVSIASLTEAAETGEIAKVETIGQVIPYSQGSLKQINISIPGYYADALIRLGESFKGEATDFFSIPYDLGVNPINMQVPEYLISILRDLYERMSKTQPGFEG